MTGKNAVEVIVLDSVEVVRAGPKGTALDYQSQMRQYVHRTGSLDVRVITVVSTVLSQPYETAE